MEPTACERTLRNRTRFSPHGAGSSEKQSVPSWTRRWLIITIVMVVVHAGVLAGDAPAIPDLTAGGHPSDDHDWTLGPTGARGWVWSSHIETAASRQILITRIDHGSPAEGLLAVGDVIVGVHGHPFTEDARKSFGRAITEAERSENQGYLRVERWRAGHVMSVTIPLLVMGTYRDSAPYQCDKSAAILERCGTYLATHPLGDGTFGAINGLGLLATGRADGQEAVRALAHRFSPPGLVVDPFAHDTSMVAWDWSFISLFLAEYCLSTGDRSVLPTIAAYAHGLAHGQSGVGTWGHGMAMPSEEHQLGGYGAINQTGLVCWLSLLLAQQLGIDDAEIRTAIARSRIFFSFYTGKGTIPYGDHPPYETLHDTNGKNALMAVIGDLIGDQSMSHFFSRMVTASFDEREAGHTGNFFSYLWGPLGSQCAGSEALAGFLAEQRWYYDLARSWDGGFPYQGAAADDSYRDWNMAGVMAITYALPLGRLAIMRMHRDHAADLTREQVRKVLAAGRPFTYERSDTSYNAEEVPVLCERLTSWSPVVRSRAACALGVRPDAVVPLLIPLLGSSNLDARLGACQALICQGGRAAPAVDALRRLITNPDPWLAIEAMSALAAIGTPARVAVPEILRRSLEDQGTDQRAMVRRYCCLALFIHNHLDDGPRRGLLADGHAGIDNDLLIRAVRRMLVLDDGFARSCVASLYSSLSDPELSQLWPAIVHAVQRPAPSGEMFADEIRLAGLDLLAQRHITEGMSIGLDYAQTQNPWSSEERTGPIMEALKRYGAAAQPLLPALRQFLDACAQDHDLGDADRKRKMAAISDAITVISAARSTPPLRSIAPLVHP